MAGFKDSSQATGVYQQVQEIIFKHIATLESDKIEEASRINQQIEIGKQQIAAQEIQIKQKNDEIEAAKVRKDAMEAKVLELEIAKQKKEGEKREIDEKLTETKRALEEEVVQKDKLSSEKQAQIEENGKIMAQKAKLLSDIAELDRQTSEKQVSRDNLVKEIVKLTDDSSVLNSKLSISQKLYDEQVAQVEVIKKEIDVLKAQKEEARQKAQEDKDLALSELSDLLEKKKQAGVSLQAVLAEVQGHKEKMEAEQKAIDVEKVFIRQFEESMKSKNKQVAFIKARLKEVITNVTSKVSEKEAAELKDLLFNIDQL